MEKYNQTIITFVLGLALMCAQSATCSAQDESVGDGATPAPADLSVEALPADALSVDQARLADRFERLEQVVLRLAELTASTDPHRAELLRAAVVQSKQQDVGERYEAIVKLLEGDQLALAVKNQELLKEDLDELLVLLLRENRSERLESERRRLRRYLKEVNRLIKRQRGTKARTEGGEDPLSLADTQSKIAQQASDLAEEIEGSEGSQEADAENDGDPQGEGEGGEQSEGEGKNQEQSESEGEGQEGSEGQGSEGQQEQQPIDQVQKQIRAAQQRMRDARKELEDARSKEAVDEQEKALAALEQAKAALNEVLRQLREEEKERTLTMLEARFRKMLKLQIEIYDGTVRLATIPVDERQHEEEIEAGRLSLGEAMIVNEADRAIRLLREDGTSVAMPEAIEQLRDDMQQVTVRLGQVIVNEITQTIEEDIIAGLEEAIAILQKTLEDLEESKGQSPGGQGGGPQNDDLVKMIDELKMIRSLQLRVNQRTERYKKLVEDGQALQSEILEALGRLSQREARIYDAARNLFLGKNE